MPESTGSDLNAYVSIDKGIGKMSIIPEEPIYAVKKSSVQTTFDLHIEYVDWTAKAANLL